MKFATTPSGYPEIQPEAWPLFAAEMHFHFLNTGATPTSNYTPAPRIQIGGSGSGECRYKYDGFVDMSLTIIILSITNTEHNTDKSKTSSPVVHLDIVPSNVRMSGTAYRILLSKCARSLGVLCGSYII